MALTVTVLDDSNHSISASKSILSRQGELGEVITFAIASTLETPYPLAWIHIRQADGSLYYIDDGAGSGFTYDGDNNFTYAIGARDSMLSVEGQLSIQVVLRDAVPPAHTVEWRSRVLTVTVEGSIVTDLDFGGSTLNSLQTGVLASLADVQYDALGDGDLLYRDTTTGKWRNVELVAGLNITKTLNKVTGELTLAAVGTLGATASNIVVADAGGYFTGSDSEAVLQEVGADLDLKAPLESPSLTGTPTAPSASGSTDTTQIATMQAVHDAINNDVGVANSSSVKTALNASGDAPIYACRAWVNMMSSDVSDLAGTYTRTLTTVAVTASGHGLVVGQSVYLNFTSGAATDGTFVVASVNGDNFTIEHGSSGTTSGNVTIEREGIRASGNVSSIADQGNGLFFVNFAIPMEDTNYAAVMSCDTTSTSENLVAGFNGSLTTYGFPLRVKFSDGTNTNPNNLSIAIFR